MFNYDLLAEVQFWRDFLGRSSSAITLPFGPSRQRLRDLHRDGQHQGPWPGIPEEHAMPFKNVEYLDDLFTWAEAEGLPDEAADEHGEGKSQVPGTAWTMSR